MSPTEEGFWSSMMSPGQSRPPSALDFRHDDGNATSEATNEAKLRLAQDRAHVREECLLQLLAELNTFSTSMTKRLDETYYAVLEKMSTLQNTVAAMRALAETSCNMGDSFNEDTRALQGEILEQLNGVSSLNGQEARIAELQGRIRHGRERIKVLTDRVDIVRERVEGWERADSAWQENTRTRLKIIWSMTSVVAVIMIVLAISANSGRVATPAGTTMTHATHNRDATGSLLRGWLSSSSLNRSHRLAADGAGTGAGCRSCTVGPDVDQRLRAFDEL